MRVDTAAFEALNDAMDKVPRYVVEIAFDTANTDLYYFTSHADSALPNGALAVNGVIKDLSGTSQSVNPEKALSTIGAINFDIVDSTSLVTTLQYDKLQLGKGLRGKRVRVYIGYLNLGWDDYTLVQTQIIEDVSYLDGSYSFNCSDIQRSIRKDIFDLQDTTLTSTVLFGDNVINVTSTTGFESVAHGVSYSDAPSQTVYYFKIEDEICRATGKTSITFTGVTRGVLNTKEVEHVVDTTASTDRRTEVTEYVYLELPAPKLMYAILTGDLLDQGGAVLPDGWHLNIDQSLVQLTDFTEFGVDVYDTTNDNNGVIVRFEGLKKQDGKKFIEKELLVLVGSFSPIYSTGLIGLKRMANVLSSSGFVYEINEDNVVSHSDLTYDMNNVQNQIEIEWNWVENKERFTRRNVLIDTDSISVNGISNPLRFKFRGLHGNRHSAETLGERFNSFRDRYAGPPIRLSVKCLLSTNTLEVGDIIRVNLPSLRDYYTDAELDRSFEVQNVSIDWISGDVNLRLFASSQEAGAISSTAAASVINDAWYTSEGINLATFVGSGYDFNTDYENIGGVGHIKLSSSILGGTDLTASSGTEGDTNSIFYHDGDLVIDTGVTLNITKNIQLRVKGHLTINGDVQGIGTGHVGAADRSDLNQEDPDTRGGASTTDNTKVYNAGVKGFLGPTVSGGGEHYNNNTAGGYITALAGNKVDGFYTSTPNLTLDYKNSIVEGIPSDLQGTSGSSGGNVGFRYGGNWYEGWHQVMGGAGGDSGAGFMVVSRGASFGASGFVNVSGADGFIGSYQPPKDTPTYCISGSNSWGSWQSCTSKRLYAHYAGGGAGGAPGAVYFVIDGDQQTFPDLASIISNYGCTRTGGTNRVAAPSIFFQDLYFPWTGYNFNCITCPPPWYPYNLGVGCDNTDLSGFEGGARVVFVVGAEAAESDVTENIIDAPTSLVLSSGTADLLLNQDGTITARIKASWTAPTDPRVTGYEMQYRENGTTPWFNAADVIGEVEGYASPIKSGTNYDLRVRSGDNIGNTSDWLTTLNYLAIGKTAPPDDVPNFSAYTNGIATIFKWDQVTDTDLSGYEIRYVTQTANPQWGDGIRLTATTRGTNVTSADVPDGSWSFMIKAVDTSGNLSVNIVFADLTIVSEYDIVSIVEEFPAWTGTFTNMIKLFDGTIMPDDQNTMDSYNNWSDFDNAVVTPYAESWYEVLTPVDMLFDSVVRVWSLLESKLHALDYVGQADPHLDIDYRLAADAFAGFAQWSIGSVNARYVKYKIHNTNSRGIPVISGMQNTADTIERSEKDAGVVISASGTTINYANPFHLPPFIEVQVQGATALYPTRENITETQFTVHVFDSSGTEVGGTIDWQATGV